MYVQYLMYMLFFLLFDRKYENFCCFLYFLLTKQRINSKKNVDQRIHEIGCKPSPCHFLPSSLPYHLQGCKKVKWLSNHFVFKESTSDFYAWIKKFRKNSPADGCSNWSKMPHDKKWNAVLLIIRNMYSI